MPDVVFGTPAFSQSRSLYWLECGSTPAQSPLTGIRHPFSDLPWVEVPHLASHILGRMAKILPCD